jgi:hypothetical protein
MRQAAQELAPGLGLLLLGDVLDEFTAGPSELAHVDRRHMPISGDRFGCATWHDDPHRRAGTVKRLARPGRHRTPVHIPQCATIAAYEAIERPLADADRRITAAGTCGAVRARRDRQRSEEEMLGRLPMRRAQEEALVVPERDELVGECDTDHLQPPFIAGWSQNGGSDGCSGDDWEVPREQT